MAELSFHGKRYGKRRSHKILQRAVELGVGPNTYTYNSLGEAAVGIGTLVPRLTFHVDFVHDAPVAVTQLQNVPLTMNEQAKRAYKRAFYERRNQQVILPADGIQIS